MTMGATAFSIIENAFTHVCLAYYRAGFYLGMSYYSGAWGEDSKGEVCPR